MINTFQPGGKSKATVGMMILFRLKKERKKGEGSKASRGGEVTISHIF